MADNGTKFGKAHKAITDMVLFAMFGAMIFASKIAFEAFPNVHPITMLIMVFTIAYGWRGLIPTFLFVIISGAYYGFPIWWIPYLYIWPLYSVLTMLLPKKMPGKVAVFVYPIVCGLFGLLYGTIYAPGQALLFGYNFQKMIKWIIAGLPWDVVHGLGNLGMGLLIYPLSELVKTLNRKIGA